MTLTNIAHHKQLISQHDNMRNIYIPSSPTLTFPKSPAWRFSSSGGPCSFPAGLKWGPERRTASDKLIANFKTWKRFFPPPGLSPNLLDIHNWNTHSQGAIYTGRHATICCVSKSMNMESMRTRLETREASWYSCWTCRGEKRPQKNYFRQDLRATSIRTD